MNTYTHLAFEDAQRELKRVNDQRMIGYIDACGFDNDFFDEMHYFIFVT